MRQKRRSGKAQKERKREGTREGREELAHLVGTLGLSGKMMEANPLALLNGSGVH